MSDIYRIVDWNQRYENNRTRELKKLEWVPVPNRMDGEGYAVLIEDHPNGTAHFGAWIAMLEIASRQDKSLRGTLPHGDAGLSHSLAKRSRIPISVFDEAIPRLLQLHWIELVSTSCAADAVIPQATAVIPQATAPRAHARREEKEEKEENRTEAKQYASPDVARGTLAEAELAETHSKFGEWWRLWSAVRGTAYHNQAFAAWPQYVTPPTLRAAFECTGSYLRSLDDPSKGFNPHTFLKVQSQDGNFQARWPQKKPNGKATDTDTLREFDNRMMREVVSINAAR